MLWPQTVMFCSVKGATGVGWYSAFVFFMLLLSTKSSWAAENISMLSYIFDWVLALCAQSSADRKSMIISFCTLVLTCSLHRLKSFPSNLYLVPNTISPSCKTSVSTAENSMLNRMGP